MSDTPKDAKAIFLAALDIGESAERAAFVARSCSGDEALQQRVNDLLHAYGQPSGPLDKLAAALAPTQLGEPIREQVGSTIGPYKLMEQIGEGGFGLVFVAEQQHPIRRKVALKIIKPGMDTREVIARFEAERQALALMDHPNIAKVLDAGTTDSGRPYFVMELVRGVPITDYCDQSQLTPRERLELFVPVCNAIQHAHLKGIIHRDVKPSNVLVSLHDDQPVVKVIDFGIAKALHQPLTERTVYTRFAQMSGLDIDTRSDIYSLGVLLYELLTGATPFDKQRFAKAAYDELLRIIREEEPPKPSMRLSKSTESLPSIAAQRNTEPAKLSRMFDGDLDWITMKALEKHRARRYETANAFAADVLRYLNDEPVEASPPSSAYRLRKFVRKYRKPVIALAAIAAVLILGIAGTTWGLFRATRAERATAIALAQMTSERDAKEEAQGLAAGAMRAAQERLAEAEAERKRAETQRDRAERQFANGLLRPIGFSNQSISTQNIDPVELRSFVDWSAIEESPLKLRVLGIALENPETAMRIARRAERVIQSCVGLSPTRRAQAIKLVSAKQRDLAADPRIRVAACRLALELGSADLPAWVKSCKWLSDSKNQSIDRFGEFVNLAISRSDPEQVAQLNVDPLLAILETSSNEKVQGALCNALPRVVRRLEPAQVKRVADVLVVILQKSTDEGVLVEAISGLMALAARLEPARLTRAWDALIAVQQRPMGLSVDNAANDGLTALAPRLEPAQLKRAADALIGALERSTDGKLLYAASRGSAAVAPSLEPAQVKRVADAVIAILEKSSDRDALSGASGGIQTLAPRLEPAQSKRAADLLVGILEKSTDVVVLQAANAGLTAMLPRLEPAQVKRFDDLLIGTLEKSTGPDVLKATNSRLAALAPWLELEPAQVKRAGNALLRIIEKSSDSNALTAVNEGLSVLAPRMEPAQARRAWDALIAMMQRVPEFKIDMYLRTDGLNALAVRLEPAQVKRAGDALIGIIETSIDARALTVANEGLTALARRMEPAQANRAWNALMSNLEKRRLPFGWLAYNAVTPMLNDLASRVEPADAKRAADYLVGVLEKSTDFDVLDAAKAGLEILVSRLEPAQSQRAGDALIGIIERSNDARVNASPQSGFEKLALRLEPAQVKRAVCALIAMLGKSRDNNTRLGAADGLVALAPRLEAAQLTRAWEALVAAATNGEIRNNWEWSKLVALAPRLEPASRDSLSTTVTATILDYCGSFGADDPEGTSLVAGAIIVARSVSSARSLAKLLSHPGCVAEQRDVLLKRFEELVLHDGKPVFLKPDASDGKKPAGDQLPPRQFQNLHDAADWIQKNWPDFDLETNCPVTWRGSH
jgi:serine/threonine protein kinase